MLFVDSLVSKIIGPKVIKINGFKEIAYLHPNHFKPDPAILERSGISPDEKFHRCKICFLECIS